MSRDEVKTLKASRQGYKAALTRIRKASLAEISKFSGGDPSLLEEYISGWHGRLQKFIVADDLVSCHEDADDADMDKDVMEHEETFFKAKVEVKGHRRDFEAARESLQIPTPTLNPVSGSSSTGLPKLDAKKPPILKEDTDHKIFIRWRPLWDNYANLISMNQRDRSIQVGLFWEVCSPGFLRIVNHSLGIESGTGRTVPEILDLVEAHLRSLRNPHLDMRDLLSIRQKEGQDYTSLTNELREQADYAGTANISEDQLLIALLLQAMSNESDKAHVMERNPSSFDDCRKYILGLETARRGAKTISDPQEIKAR